MGEWAGLLFACAFVLAIAVPTIIGFFAAVYFLSRWQWGKAKTAWQAVADQLGLAFVDDPTNAHIAGTLRGIPVRVKRTTQTQWMGGGDRQYRSRVPFTVVRATPRRPIPAVAVPRGQKFKAEGMVKRVYEDAEIAKRYDIYIPSDARADVLSATMLQTLRTVDPPVYLFDGAAVWLRGGFETDASKLGQVVKNCAQVAAAFEGESQ